MHRAKLGMAGVAAVRGTSDASIVQGLSEAMSVAVI